MAQKTVRVLSIDWDYFIEEDPMLDWGHREDSFFLNEMWKVRRIKVNYDMKTGKVTHEPLDLKRVAPFCGDIKTITTLPCFGFNKVYQIATAESHQAILQLLKGIKNLEIVNIDAHHDIFYKYPCGELDVNSEDNVVAPDCGSWGSYLMSQGQVKSWLQVYPEWRKKFFEHSVRGVKRWATKNGHKFSVVYGAPPVTWRKVDYVFICRSGCWAPPEYDNEFEALCYMLGANKWPNKRSLESLEVPSDSVVEV